MRAVDEFDLKAIGSMEEKRNWKHAKAVSEWRKMVMKLADPDAPNRSEIVLENFNRGTEPAAPKAAKTEKDMKQKSKKEKKAPVAKAKAEAPKIAEFSHEVELTPIEGQTRFYQVKYKNRLCTAHLVERDREADRKFSPLNTRPKFLATLKKLAKERDQDPVVCLSVLVAGKASQGYIVDASLGHDHETYVSFVLTADSLKQYASEGWDGVKFSEAKPEAKSQAA